MTLLKPDPTFYPSPMMATQSPAERLAYVALINPLKDERTDAIGVVDLDPASASHGRLIGQADMPPAGDELHQFGWNACSSCLCPYAPHAHMERRYLIVLGINSSRIHSLDTKHHPRRPKIVKRWPGQALNGGPQMVEISRDGKRIYFTNSLYTPWDDQFYPDGVRGWMAKVNVRPESGMELDEKFFLRSDGMRPHQVRLEGGDASSDSYCYA